MQSRSRPVSGWPLQAVAPEQPAALGKWLRAFRQECRCPQRCLGAVCSPGNERQSGASCTGRRRRLPAPSPAARAHVCSGATRPTFPASGASVSQSHQERAAWA